MRLVDRLRYQRTTVLLLQKLGFLANRLLEVSSLSRISYVDRIWVSIYFVYKAKFEKNTLLWIKQNKELLKFTLDVGGGFGFYTLFIAELSEIYQVDCFEPDHINFNRIQRQIKSKKLKNIRTHNIAVTEKISTVFLKRDLFNPANHSISFSGELDSEIKGISLDEFCRQYGVIPTFVKIDVQGHEQFVLQGSIQLLSVVKPVILIEFDVQSQKENSQNCFNILKKNKFVGHIINSDGSLFEVNELPDNKHYFDLIFLPE